MVSAKSKQKTILIVEDNRENLMLVNDALEYAGYQIRVADTGVIALKILERETPDLIIMDLMLPNMSGHQIIKKIRRTPGKQNIPIIVCTASGHRSDVLKCVKLGIHDYVLKPINVKAFLNKVESALNEEVQVFENDQNYEEVGFDSYDSADESDAAMAVDGVLTLSQDGNSYAEEAGPETSGVESESSKKRADELEEGMVLKKSVKRNNAVIMSEGTKLTGQLIKRLQEWDVEELEVFS